jgi:plasmid stability protein
MASLLIRNLDAETKTRLRIRAAENGRSLEEEARLTLQGSVKSAADAQLTKPENWVRLARQLFADAGFADDFEIPEYDQGYTGFTLHEDKNT